MKATEVTAGLAESNGSLLPGLWRDSLHVTCGLTACTPGLAPGPTLGNEYGRTLPFIWPVVAKYEKLLMVCLLPPTETPLQFFISVSADLLSTSANVSVFNLLSWYYSHQLLIHFSLSMDAEKIYISRAIFLVDQLIDCLTDWCHTSLYWWRW